MTDRRVLVLLRHLLAIALLPFVMTIVIPVWIARANEVTYTWPGRAVAWVSSSVGVGLVAIGLALFGASLWRFAIDGRGTLGNWDPPRRLVVTGLYRRVRNPMISGVILVLFGEAALLRSLPHTLWAGFFLALNVTYIPLLEEPQLSRRFGADYERYRRHVPRFLPRLRPWNPEESDTG